MLKYERAILEDAPAQAGSRQAALTKRVERTLETIGGTEAQVVRVTLPVEPVDPLTWLRAQPDLAKVYWAGRRTARSVAGVGTADVLEIAEGPADLEYVQRQLDERWTQADGPLRYFGGLRFDDRTSAREDRWAGFGTCRFVLPRVELRTDGYTATLACNLVLPRDAECPADLRGALEELVDPRDGASRILPQPSARTDAPGRTTWMEMVTWALQAIDRETLGKVVLARRSTLDFLKALDPLSVLQHLQAATPGCFHFAFQPEAGHAFIGASPERLFRQDGRHVHTEAVAGTRSRGASDQADAALREELLASEKDRREHAFVQDTIREVLAPLCTCVDLDQPPSEMKLTRGRHLRSRLEATLRKGVMPLDVLEALHPTPAVGGVPTTKARQAIRTQEPFDRGWYAGPVGWIEPDAAEFAVALRCGLVRGAHLDLFSGAGIVEGSVPEREWDEIEQKISDFAAVLNLDTESALDQQ